MNNTEQKKGKRMSNEEIASLRLLTNQVEVKVNEEKFFKRYRIVSYYTNDKEKNLPYERLGKRDFVSVTGLWNFWDDDNHGYVKFFVLVRAGEEKPIVDELRVEYGASIDDLQDYPDKMQQCVLGSLMVNALNRRKENGCEMMYNCGSLYLLDDINFGNRDSTTQKIALKVTLNRYLQLIPSVTTFSSCESMDELKTYARNKPIFKVHRFLDGEQWSGETLDGVKRNAELNGQGKINWSELYIIHNRYKHQHNTASFLSFELDKEEHSRVMALAQVVDSVNDLFTGLGSMKFVSYKVEEYDQYTRRSYKREAENLILDYFTDKKVLLQNTMERTGDLDKYIGCMKDLVVSKTGQAVLTEDESLDPSQNMVLRLIMENDDQRRARMKGRKRKKDKEDEEKDKVPEVGTANQEENTQKETKKEKVVYADQYVKGQERDKYLTLQHITYGGGKGISKNEIHRILLELIVKDCISTCRMPAQFVERMKGWESIEYRVNKKDRLIYGTSMTVSPEGEIAFTDYGCSNNRWSGMGFDAFVKNKLHFAYADLIFGSQWYKVMIKEDNVYLIVSTEEFPMLNTVELGRFYAQFHVDPETGQLRDERDFRYTLVKNLFRVGNVDRLLSGLIGFRYWPSEPLMEGGMKGISYLVGINHDVEKTNLMEIHKTARVKKIFVLSSRNPQKVNIHLKEIFAMLKHPFGRCGEMGTFPLPFKFVEEYLDDVTLKRQNLHWTEYNSKRFDKPEKE